MPIHDYECRACGHVERDLYYSRESIPKLKRCPSCKKKESRQIFDQFGAAQIHSTISSMYGYWHPQMGEVIRDYTHKRQLMRRYNMEEGSDPVRGNRKPSEDLSDDDQPDPGDSGVIWGDEESIRKQVEGKAVILPGREGGRKVLGA